MSGTVARSLGAMGDAMVGTANVNFDAGTLFVDSVNNRVGVGITTPAATLHSWLNTNNGTIGAAAILDAGTQNPSVSGGGIAMNFRTNSGSSFFGGVGGYTDGTNYVAGLWGGAAASGAPALAVTSAGNVGIGTSSPSFPLDVAGAIRGNSWIGRTNTSVPTADAAIYRPADNTLGFVTGSTERMRVAANGNIGIGSSTPGFPLTINRGGGAVMAIMDGGDFRFYNLGNGGFVDVFCDTSGEFRVSGSISVGELVQGSLNHGTWRGRLDRAWDNYPSITIDNTTDRGPQGEFRIHGSPGANGGDFSIATRSDGGFISGSDSRRKTNIQAIANPLDRVLAIAGKQYQVVNKDGEVEDSLSHSGKKIGFIGQEIIEVLPEVVKFYPEADTPTESGWASAYSIDYGSVTALLVEAIKEQQALIRSLTARLSALENK